MTCTTVAQSLEASIWSVLALWRIFRFRLAMPQKPGMISHEVLVPEGHFSFAVVAPRGKCDGTKRKLSSFSIE
jgi:hypothetical protein